MVGPEAEVDGVDGEVTRDELGVVRVVEMHAVRVELLGGEHLGDGGGVYLANHVLDATLNHLHASARRGDATGAVANQLTRRRHRDDAKERTEDAKRCARARKCARGGERAEAESGRDSTRNAGDEDF